LGEGEVEDLPAGHQERVEGTAGHQGPEGGVILHEEIGLLTEEEEGSRQGEVGHLDDVKEGLLEEVVLLVEGLECTTQEEVFLLVEEGECTPHGEVVHQLEEVAGTPHQAVAHLVQGTPAEEISLLVGDGNIDEVPTIVEANL